MDPELARRYGGAVAAIAREAEFSGWEAEAAHMPDDPAEVARSLQDVAERYIDRVIETAGPRVIVVDDLHWIDHSSAPMLELLVQRTTQLPLVIFGAMRPGPAPSWAATSLVRRIRLAGLRELESGQLATIVARAALNAADAREIHERTGGNPLFVTETVRAFLNDGTLAVQDGLLTLIDGAGASLPVTLRSVLGARIDALSPAAREVLGVASVIGMRFRTSMVGAVVGGPLSAEIVQELAQSALISPIDQELWRFGHALIRDAAYSGLLASTRRELHARVADELEHEEPAPPVAWIARHRAAAGDRERGLPLLDEAAQAALAIGAGREAAAFWREAAELAGDPEDAMRFLHQASEAARAAVAVDPRLG
jgi:predicted ATPase